jgi:uncharacterized protein YukE
MSIKEDMDTIETRMAELAGTVKLEEEKLRTRLEKGRTVIAYMADSSARMQAQAFFNYMENWYLRLEMARKALDQSAVLVKDGDTYVVVDQIDDKSRALIQTAERQGARVTEVQKIEKQEALL